MSIIRRLLFALLVFAPLASLSRAETQNSSPGQNGTNQQEEIKSSPGDRAKPSPKPSIGSRTEAMPNEVRQDSGGPDRNFVSNALTRSMEQLDLARVAQQKASSREVQALAGKVISDENRGKAVLQDFAREFSLQVASDEDRETRNRLSILTGTEFDRTYLDYIVKTYGEKLTQFREETNLGNDRRLKQFAAKELPVLEDHLLSAVQLLKRLGGALQVREPSN